MKKVIVITGASSWMWKETAKKLISEGHTVYALARRIEQMEDLQSLWGYPMQMDVSNENEIIQTVKTIIQKEWKIDVLWNNAWFGLYGTVEDVPLDEARRQFEVNVFWTANMIQKVLPYMREKKSWTIINTSSMWGKMYFPMWDWYHASKHAIEWLSDCLRLDLKAFNINVVILEPWFIATEFGWVLIQNLSKIKNSAYSNLMSKIMAGTKKSDETWDNSDPSVIANAISKIVNTTKPKTRYKVGKYAKLMVWMRVYLWDKIFDNIVMSQIK